MLRDCARFLRLWVGFQSVSVFCFFFRLLGCVFFSDCWVVQVVSVVSSGFGLPSLFRVVFGGKHYAAVDVVVVQLCRLLWF